MFTTEVRQLFQEGCSFFYRYHLVPYSPLFPSPPAPLPLIPFPLSHRTLSDKSDDVALMLQLREIAETGLAETAEMDNNAFTLGLLSYMALLYPPPTETVVFEQTADADTAILPRALFLSHALSSSSLASFSSLQWEKVLAEEPCSGVYFSKTPPVCFDVLTLAPPQRPS